MVIIAGHLAAQLSLVSIACSVYVANDDSFSLRILVKTPSWEGGSAVSVPGHWSRDKKPLAEVFTGSCFLLFPGLCGRCQSSCGHPGQTPAGHHQEASTAGDTHTHGRTVQQKLVTFRKFWDINVLNGNGVQLFIRATVKISYCHNFSKILTLIHY